MPKISVKAQAMPESPIRRLAPYADEAKRQGKIVYHLNIGQPDIPTPKVALDAIKNLDDNVLAYSHSAGNPSYRKKLSEYYKTVDIDVTPDEMLITTGGSEAITFAFMVTMNPGDEVIIPEPFYANYNGFAVTAGVTIKPITSNINDDFGLPPIENFEKLITKKTKGIVICNPNNPTGYLYSEDELRQLEQLVKKHDLYLFSDEVYREFCYDGRNHFSVMNLNDITDNVIMMDSVSKRYSMCGIRVGCMISKNKDIIAAALKFGQARLCPPYLGQVAAEAAIDTPKAYFDEVYDEYIQRRDYMVKRLNQMEGVKSPLPKGAFYSTVELPVDDTDKFAQWLLEEFDYQGKTVMLAPASGFYSTPGLGKKEVRIAYVLNIKDLENAMESLEEALKTYPGRTI
ncbi:MAG: pyridoxal phosphate-dependent aminotransferase [Bacteroidales bacterium]